MSQQPYSPSAALGERMSASGKLIDAINCLLLGPTGREAVIPISTDRSPFGRSAGHSGIGRSNSLQ
jgi:hypothetical protein